MIDNKKIDEIKRLMLYFIFSTPGDDREESFLGEIEAKLRAAGVLEQTWKCFYACREYAKAMINEELKKKGESK